jgi:hypothetical protein
MLDLEAHKSIMPCLGGLILPHGWRPNCQVEKPDPDFPAFGTLNGQSFPPWRERTKRSKPRMEGDMLRQKRCVKSKGFCFAVRPERAGKGIK